MATQLRAGLYACDPTALTEIVERALTKLDQHDAADRVQLFMQLTGIEVGELRKALSDERAAHRQTSTKLAEAREELRRLRVQNDNQDQWAKARGLCRDLERQLHGDNTDADAGIGHDDERPALAIGGQ